MSAALVIVAAMPDAIAEEAERKARAASAPIAGRCAQYEPLPGTPSVPVGYIFGLTDPTDPGDPCTWELVSETYAHTGKRDGRYAAIASKIELSHTYSHNVAFAFSVFNTYSRWSEVTAMRDTLAGEGNGVSVNTLNRMDFDGLSGEVFVRVLSRAPNQPLAMTLALEPRWSRVDSVTGYRADGFAAEFKLLMDIAVTSRLFAAFNLNYTTGVQKFAIPAAAWIRYSYADGSAALSSEVYASKNGFVERVVVGVEAGLRSVFEGLTLNGLVSSAVFLGPTFGIGFSGERFLNVAWQPQIAGRIRSPGAAGRLSLDSYERQEFRVKLATPVTP